MSCKCKHRSCELNVNGKCFSENQVPCLVPPRQFADLCRAVTTYSSSVHPAAIAEHKARHKLLLCALNELLADFVAHTDKLPSKTAISELLAWSVVQTAKPDA